MRRWQKVLWPIVLWIAGLGCGLHDKNNDLGGAINLALAGEYLVVARGSAGIDVRRLDSLEVATHLDPAGDADSYDDVSVDGAIVLVHDADDGLVSSFRLQPDGGLVAVSSDVAVESGPYSGVSVSGGVAIVSGGTCGISRLSVAAGGELAVTGGVEVFRGQPDVSMVPGTSTALLSTHFSGRKGGFVDGQEFGIMMLSTDELAVVATAGLAGAGFSDGGGRPASWPVRASIVGDLAFVAHGGGLDLFRIDASSRMERLGHLDLPFQAVDVFAPASGGEVFVVGVPPQVGIVDVGADQALSLRDTVALGAEVRPTAIVASEAHIIVADNLGAPVIVDR